MLFSQLVRLRPMPLPARAPRGVDGSVVQLVPHNTCRDQLVFRRAAICKLDISLLAIRKDMSTSFLLRVHRRTMYYV